MIKRFLNHFEKRLTSIRFYAIIKRKLICTKRFSHNTLFCEFLMFSRRKKPHFHAKGIDFWPKYCTYGKPRKGVAAMLTMRNNIGLVCFVAPEGNKQISPVTPAFVGVQGFLFS